MVVILYLCGFIFMGVNLEMLTCWWIAWGLADAWVWSLEPSWEESGVWGQLDAPRVQWILGVCGRWQLRGFWCEMGCWGVEIYFDCATWLVNNLNFKISSL